MTQTIENIKDKASTLLITALLIGSVTMLISLIIAGCGFVTIGVQGFMYSLLIVIISSILTVLITD